MSDMRLIDANALPNYKFNVTIEVGEHKDPAEIRVAFWEDVKNAPTIDAVPVVRCEHCKEAVECQVYGEHCGLPAEKGIFCEVWQTVVDKNGYCYQGEKMDGGAEG
jgi:hypothetical protein